MKDWIPRIFHSRYSSPGKPNRHGKPSASDASRPRPGAFPRPVGGVRKLGTFAGVLVPVTLNVLSIIMFLRFGFILGQTSVVGMMGMLLASYSLNFVDEVPYRCHEA
jgi:potassium/chloride transporter 9